jgi:hypothetical protein
MNLATGMWEEVFVDNTFTTSFSDGANDIFEWKVGMYRGQTTAEQLILYDDIRYGRWWNLITKNKLTGHRKTILKWQFNEATASGDHVWDTCYERNGGAQNDPVYDYDNDGLISSATRISGGVLGSGDKCLYLNGTSNYVSAPIDKIDFDTGNYQTLSCWFKTSNSQSSKALICVDESSTTWKSRIYLYANNKIDFCVRHPDTSTTQYTRYTKPSGTLCDGNWHHVVGTYNRFAADGKRLKLYLDGIMVAQSTGVDKPLLRGDNYILVGKYSSNYYKGYIDEVMVCNYEMTGTEVETLYDWYINY